MRIPPLLPRLALLAQGAMLGLAACALPAALETASAPAPARSDKRAAAKAAHGPELAELAAAHQANPGEVAAARAYARALRGAGAKPAALAVLERAAAKAKDRALTLERGLLTLELGQADKAERLLRQLDDATAPDWRVHSALGAALASRGKQPEAQAQFAKALALAPEHPSVLNNLALSYALDGKAEEAEKLLLRAHRAREAAPEVPQNLALVLGLRGKFDAAKAAAGALPADQASANIAYLKALTGAKIAPGKADAEAPKLAAVPVPPTYQFDGPR
jgi:Flp pilus assembly protein TadD